MTDKSAYGESRRKRSEVEKAGMRRKRMLMISSLGSELPRSS